MSIAEQTAELILRPPDKPDHSLFHVYAEKPYHWTSGTLNPVYTNMRLFQSLPEARRLLTRLMLKKIEEIGLNPDGLVAVATGSIFLTAGLAHLMNLPMITVRPQEKEHGAEGLIDGLVTQWGKYLVIEDVYSTGGSAIRAARTVMKGGGIVDSTLAILHYNWPEAYQAFKEANINAINLVDFPILLKKAIELRNIANEKIAVIRDWQQDHIGWAKRHGYE